MPAGGLRLRLVAALAPCRISPVEGPFGPILQANILGAHSLYEAARKQGTKRIVFASSNHVRLPTAVRNHHRRPARAP